MTDITLGSFGLLENITSWEVSSEPSLSYLTHAHTNTHSVHSMGLCTGMPDG